VEVRILPVARDRYNQQNDCRYDPQNVSTHRNPLVGYTLAAAARFRVMLQSSKKANCSSCESGTGRTIAAARGRHWKSGLKKALAYKFPASPQAILESLVQLVAYLNCLSFEHDSISHLRKRQ
jgi:hypothetical protein